MMRFFLEEHTQKIILISYNCSFCYGNTHICPHPYQLQKLLNFNQSINFFTKKGFGGFCIVLYNIENYAYNGTKFVFITFFLGLNIHQQPG